LPGVYYGGRAPDKHIGGKPIDLVSAIVRDYTREGDLICDPFAGFGTTLLAAAMNGRRAIGAEADPETFERAVEKLSRGYTPIMFAE
jgi:site-specific DNA-methyltransferase (adenine-specific)